MLYNREVKKEREFSNLSALKSKHLDGSVFSRSSKTKASFQKQKDHFLGSDTKSPNTLIELKEIGQSGLTPQETSRERTEEPKLKQRENLNIYVEYFAYYRINGSKRILPQNQ